MNAYVVMIFLGNLKDHPITGKQEFKFTVLKILSQIQSCKSWTVFYLCECYVGNSSMHFSMFLVVLGFHEEILLGFRIYMLNHQIKLKAGQRYLMHNDNSVQH